MCDQDGSGGGDGSYSGRIMGKREQGFFSVLEAGVKLKLVSRKKKVTSEKDFFQKEISCII